MSPATREVMAELLDTGEAPLRARRMLERLLPAQPKPALAGKRSWGRWTLRVVERWCWKSALRVGLRAERVVRGWRVPTAATGVLAGCRQRCPPRERRAAPEPPRQRRGRASSPAPSTPAA